MLTMVDNNIIYKLGRNAKENFKLIDEATLMNDNYWWFHMKDIPSGHCIIYSDVIDKQMIINAAIIVKQYSKLKDTKSKVKIVYTQIKYIKKTKTIGQVLLIGYTGAISL